MKAFDGFLEEERFLLVVLAGRHRLIDASMQHDLHLTVIRWLQQDRIHIHFGFDAGGFRLDYLSSADFAAISADVGIQCHVLGFEWCDANPTLPQDPAQCGNQYTLTVMCSPTHAHQTSHP